jgi:hypothetical protein
VRKQLFVISLLLSIAITTYVLLDQTLSTSNKLVSAVVLIVLTPTALSRLLLTESTKPSKKAAYLRKEVAALLRRIAATDLGYSPKKEEKGAIQVAMYGLMEQTVEAVKCCPSATALEMVGLMVVVEHFFNQKEAVDLHREVMKSVVEDRPIRSLDDDERL